jgi:putative flippase GtrA/2-polyprenyl-3-methyl-5-hydroxy-6-metoxy-1,4-benzoquinol methylase
MPPKSKIGNYFSRFLFFLGTGRYVPDTQSGFRLLSSGLAAALLDAVSWRRYETEAEMLSKAVALGFTVATVEIPTIYFDRNRRTHFDPLWDSMRVIAVLSRYALTSLAVTAIDISAFVLALTYVTPGLVRANVLARAVSVLVHFMLSRSYVFKVQGRFHAIEAVRYGLTVLANLALTTVLLVALEPRLPNALAAKIVAQLIGFGFTFVVLDRIVFRPRAAGRTDWERYYRHPYATAKWSRGIMARALARAIERHRPVADRASLLEIGGGNSCFLEGLMDRFRFGEYWILDNSAEGMRRARERFAPRYGDRVRYREADVFEPAGDLEGRFDIVLSVGLIEHFTDDEMARLVRLHAGFAKPDGLVIIAVPTPTLFYRIVRTGAELLGIWQFPDERPIRRGRLVTLMSNAGLAITSQQTFWSQLLTQALVTGAREPARSGEDEGVRTDRSTPQSAWTIETPVPSETRRQPSR